jgi:hypothetical protein
MEGDRGFYLDDYDMSIRKEIDKVVISPPAC